MANAERDEKILQIWAFCSEKYMIKSFKDRVQCFGYYDFGWVYQFKKLKLPKIRNRWTTLICYILVSRFNLTFDYDEKPDQRVWFKLVIGLSTGWSYLLNNRKLLKLYFKVITTLILFKGQGLVASVSKKWTSCQPSYLPITFWSSAKTRERIIRLNFEWRDVASEMWPVTQYYIKRSKVVLISALIWHTLLIWDVEIETQVTSSAFTFWQWWHKLPKNHVPPTELDQVWYQLKVRILLTNQLILTTNII